MKVTLTRFQRNLFHAFLLLLGVQVFLILAWQLAPFIPDDSYISFRYAENLASGKGLTFNALERPVEGYTNLLWVLCCALIAKCGANLPSAAPVLGCILGIFSIIVFFFIIQLRRLSLGQTIASLLLFSCSGPFVLYSISGMETPLFSLLLLLGVLCFDRILQSGRTIWYVVFPIVSFLLALCRPEGIIFFPLTAFLILSKYKFEENRNSQIAALAARLILGLVFFVFLIAIYECWRISYFGEYFPTPFLSKGAGHRSQLMTWNTNLKFYFLTQNHYFAPLGYYFLGLIALALFAIQREFARKNRFPLFELGVFAIALAYTFVYLNFVDWMPGMRYHAPLAALFLIPASSIFKTRTAPGQKSLSTKIWHLLPTLTLIIIINLSFIAALRFDAIRNEQITRKSVVALGRWLERNVPSNTLFAISDVGAAPYFSGLPTLDSNPQSLTDIYIAKNGWSKEYFLKRKPGIATFVSFSLIEPKFYGQHYDLLIDPRFSEEYRLIGKIRSDWYRDRSYWIYAHNSLPFSDKQVSSIPFGLER